MNEEAVTLIGPHEPWERQLLYRRSRLETAEEPGEGSTGKLGKEKPFPALSVPPAPSADEAYIMASGRGEYLQSPPPLSQSRKEGWIWS